MAAEESLPDRTTDGVGVEVDSDDNCQSSSCGSSVRQALAGKLFQKSERQKSAATRSKSSNDASEAQPVDKRLFAKRKTREKAQWITV